MTKNQGEEMPGGNAIECEADICVTNTAASYFNNHFAAQWLESR
jgi:hypothetical protein